MAYGLQTSPLMLKHALFVSAAASVAFFLGFSAISRADNEIRGVVTCTPPQLQPVSNPHDPEIELHLNSGETARREYDIPNTDARVALALSYEEARPQNSQEAATGLRGRFTISKTFFHRSPRGVQLMMVMSPPNSLVVRENGNSLELASHPAAPEGRPAARVVIGSNGSPIPRFAVDCEINSR